ncbi:enoyl-CoA hydratase/isomerase family protein [Rhizobium pusense]|uniref:3-hydroxyacyl-CoA dehydrogenase NAD-binding domain-containing protein n=1 Tax=Agrobacterium pusense TaxID=648995 RepID=UPI001FCE27E0|nr:3-hydroxyacyl-CoA dehydrogenase NAD-binding domain-containing protein [Agrobacterium pusense]MCJ2877397.1 enoyl-CoA hydratase/isomerase family protein [Agrobacterium pusense]
MSIIRRDIREGMAILTWDQPDSPVNIKSRAALAELALRIDEALSDTAVAGIVLCSAKADFVVGGDLAELQAARTAEDACALVGDLRHTLRRLESAGKVAVAAIQGKALGGGLELALACHGRVAVEGAELGLPEVTLGLMPGAGGTQRLPRLIGAETALSLMTSGKSISADAALELGLVDEIAALDSLVPAAIALANRLSPRQPWDAGRKPEPLAPDALAALRKRCAERSGEGDMAEAAIIDTVNQGLLLKFEAALDLEAKAFGALVASTTAKNLIRTSFYAMNRARSISSRPKDVAPYGLSTVAVVGAGTMGGGIAFTAASAGLKVRLVEVSQDALDRGMQRIGRTAERQIKAGRLTPPQASEVLSRILPQTDYSHFGDVDLAVEAVVEIEAVKAQVLTQLAGAMRPGAPIASNTSTLPISRLAQFCTRPDDVIGLHFFGPVERMPLVEVICGRETSSQTLARSLDLMKRLRKVPIIVQDGLGFYTSRVVAAYTGEAMTLIGEGVSPEVIDAAATGFGMKIGPCQMNDMTGLPLLIDIYSSLRDESRDPAVTGDRSVETLQALVAAGRTGKREGFGIYDYPPEGDVTAWAGLSDLFPAKAAIDPAEVKARLVYAQVLEAARAIEEGITEPADADVGSLLGWMFPKWTGGTVSYIDTVGVQTFVVESQRLATLYGGRFTPPRKLVEMAREQKAFYAV